MKKIFFRLLTFVCATTMLLAAGAVPALAVDTVRDPVTVQIPGTDVTFRVEGAAAEYGYTTDHFGIMFAPTNDPKYIFTFPYGGKVTFHGVMDFDFWEEEYSLDNNGHIKMYSNAGGGWETSVLEYEDCSSHNHVCRMANYCSVKDTNGNDVCLIFLQGHGGRLLNDVYIADDLMSAEIESGSAAGTGDANAYWDYSENRVPTFHLTTTMRNIQKNSLQGGYLCDAETIRLFSKDPGTYDPEMSKLAATLSQKTYEGEASIEGFVREKGFEKVYSNNYGGSLAFTVATKPYYRSATGEQTDILLIAAQGSTNLYELANDANSLATTLYKGYYVYDIVRDFRNAIVEGLPNVTNPNRNYKVLVTGHSLGGAAANLVAAQLTDEYIAGVNIQNPKSDVFCYTFGAINSLNKNTLVQSGYENIHNVYNDQDTFSPKMYGTWLPTGMGLGFGKFGHMDLFSWDYRTAADRGKWDVTQIIDALNHKIDHYVDVVSGNDPNVDISNCYSTCIKHNTHNQAYGRYSLVGCPVDVDVYCEGKLVGRVKNNMVDTSVSTIEIIVEDTCKYFIYPDDRQYDLHITAFDDGRMLFLTQDTVDDTPTLKVIAGVELSSGKELYSEVGGTVAVSDIKLYVVDDNGDPIAEVQEDGSEVAVTPSSPPHDPPAIDPDDTPELTFTDVPAGAYYAEAVKWAVKHKVTDGTTTTTFSPDKFCTRGEIVTFLWRAYGFPEPTTTVNPFTDVKSSDYFYKAVLWAAENNITTGTTDTTFSPGDSCNRAQAVTFQYRAAKKPPVSGSGAFNDVPAGTWYSDAVIWAAENEITTGTTTTTFSPDKLCTRAEIVTFLYRYMGE